MKKVYFLILFQLLMFHSCTNFNSNESTNQKKINTRSTNRTPSELYNCNLAPNPGFERYTAGNFAGWVKGGEINKATFSLSENLNRFNDPNYVGSPVQSGSLALKVVVNSPGDIFFRIGNEYNENTSIPVIPNTKYYFSARLKTSSGSTAGLRVIEWDNSGAALKDNHIASGTSDSDTDSDGWITIEGTITTTSNTNYVSLRLSHHYTSGTFYWDDITIWKHYDSPNDNYEYRCVDMRSYILQSSPGKRVCEDPNVAGANLNPLCVDGRKDAYDEFIVSYTNGIKDHIANNKLNNWIGLNKSSEGYFLYEFFTPNYSNINDLINNPFDYIIHDNFDTLFTTKGCMDPQDEKTEETCDNILKCMFDPTLDVCWATKWWCLSKDANSSCTAGENDYQAGSYPMSILLPVVDYTIGNPSTKIITEPGTGIYTDPNDYLTRHPAGINIFNKSDEPDDGRKGWKKFARRIMNDDGTQTHEGLVWHRHFLFISRTVDFHGDLGVRNYVLTAESDGHDGSIPDNEIANFDYGIRMERYFFVPGFGRVRENGATQTSCNKNSASSCTGVYNQASPGPTNFNMMKQGDFFSPSFNPFVTRYFWE